MLKHNNHLKHNEQIIKDTIRGMGTKRSMASSKNDSF